MEHISDGWRSKVPAIVIILAIVVVGPIIGFVLGAYRIVLPPRWSFLTAIIYLLMPCLALWIGVLAVVKDWIPFRRMVLVWISVGIIAIFYLVNIVLWLPVGLPIAFRSKLQTHKSVMFVCTHLPMMPTIGMISYWRAWLGGLSCA
jgi:hypothetical protein